MSKSKMIKLKMVKRKKREEWVQFASGSTRRSGPELDPEGPIGQESGITASLWLGTRYSTLPLSTRPKRSPQYISMDTLTR